MVNRLEGYSHRATAQARRPEGGRCDAPQLLHVSLTLEFLTRGERPRQLRAGADVELAVGVAEVGLDRLEREEELLRDLAVGPAFGGHLGDAAFTGGEGLDPDWDEAAQLLAGGPELAVGALGERERATAPRQLEAGAQRLAGVASMAGAPQAGPKVGEGACVLEPRGGALE